MFKVLLIMALAIYILSKVGSFFFKVGAASNQRQDQPRRPADGNVNINSAPRKEKKSSVKGGDYIDYEEIK